MSELIGAKTAPAEIKEGSIETFEADVLNASMTMPVVVDFWAEWCGPCKQLAPALEKAVNAAGGKVALVKIDIDKNQMLASQLRIQSVPTVYAFWQGRPVDGFQGAVPESEITAFIERLKGLANEAGGGGDSLDDHLGAADELLAAGDVAAAAELYGRIAEADPENMRALAGLARAHLALKDFDQARAILKMVPEGKADDPAFAGVRAALDLAANARPESELAALADKVAGRPDDHAARYELAEARIASGEMEAGIDDLLAIIARDREWNEGAARQKLLTAFDALGGAHPLTIKGRRRLSSILFS